MIAAIAIALFVVAGVAWKSIAALRAYRRERNADRFPFYLSKLHRVLGIRAGFTRSDLVEKMAAARRGPPPVAEQVSGASKYDLRSRPPVFNYPRKAKDANRPPLHVRLPGFPTQATSPRLAAYDAWALAKSKEPGITPADITPAAWEKSISSKPALALVSNLKTPERDPMNSE